MRVRLLALMVASGLVAAGCGARPAPAAGPDATAEGRHLPDVVLRTPDGGAARLDELRGDHVAFVTLWASWCTTCREEFSTLNRLHDGAVAQGAVVLGVAVGDTPAQVGSFTSARLLRFPQLVDEDFAFADALGQRSVPAHLVVDREGRVVHRGDSIALALAAFREALAR